MNMKEILALLLVAVLAFQAGRYTGIQDTYQLIISECRKVGGFFYGNTVVRAASVTDLEPKPPTPERPKKSFEEMFRESNEPHTNDADTEKSNKDMKELPPAKIP